MLFLWDRFAGWCVKISRRKRIRTPARAKIVPRLIGSSGSVLLPGERTLLNLRMDRWIFVRCETLILLWPAGDEAFQLNLVDKGGYGVESWLPRGSFPPWHPFCFGCDVRRNEILICVLGLNSTKVFWANNDWSAFPLYFAFIDIGVVNVKQMLAFAAVWC